MMDFKKGLLTILILLGCSISYAGVNLDGVDDYINLGTNTIYKSSPFSYSIWIKPNAPGDFTSPACKLGAVGSRVWFLLRHSDGRYYAAVYNSSDTEFNTYVGTEATTVDNGVWANFIFTFNGTSTYRLYKDGVLQSEKTDFTGTLKSSDPETRLGMS